MQLKAKGLCMLRQPKTSIQAGSMWLCGHLEEGVVDYVSKVVSFRDDVPYGNEGVLS